MQPAAYRGSDVVRFLQHLLRHLPGQLLVIWDGASIHRAQPVKDFLAAGAAARLQLVVLPGYAPELNPTEWRPSKDRDIGSADEMPGAYHRNAPGPSTRRAASPRGAAVLRAG
jgi:hypothetical protein